MKCYNCHCQMQRQEIDATVTWGSRTVRFRGVEAWVCPQCGERAYEAADASMMQGLTRATVRMHEPPLAVDISEVRDLLPFRPQAEYERLLTNEPPVTKEDSMWRFSRPLTMARLRGELVAPGNSQSRPGTGAGDMSTGVRIAARADGEISLSEKDRAIVEKHLDEMGR